jgi:hypothetical protein
MMVQKLGYGFTLVFCSALSACSSGHNSVGPRWLSYQQGDASSFFALSVTSLGTASVSARGPFADETRTVGQSSDAELTPAQVEELEALVDAGLLEIYEADDAIAAGSNVGSATDPAFYVSLDADALDSPAPRDASLGFENDEPLSEETRTLISKLNAILRDVWSRGEKSGPNPDIAEPAVF